MSELQTRQQDKEIAAVGHRLLELYIAGDTVHSRRAQANLEEIVNRLEEPVTVKIIDVIEAPKAAFARRIFATPALVSIRDGQMILIIGDLADREAVLQRLGVADRRAMVIIADPATGQNASIAAIPAEKA